MKVLICLDYSTTSDIVLKESEKFLKAFPQAEVWVHTVQDIAILSGDQGFGGAIVHDLEAEVDQLRKKTETTFGSRPIHFSHSTGVPVDEILAQVKRLNCTLLVLGTHGRKGFNHLMLGSVAEKVLRHAECNTLVIPVNKKS